MVGHQYYPPPNAEHYTLLQLHEFNTNSHRGSFLLKENIKILESSKEEK